MLTSSLLMELPQSRQMARSPPAHHPRARSGRCGPGRPEIDDRLRTEFAKGMSETKRLLELGRPTPPAQRAAASKCESRPPGGQSYLAEVIARSRARRRVRRI